MKCTNVSLADLKCPRGASGNDDIVEPPRLGCDTDHVKECDRAIARERRAEMFHFVGPGHAVNTNKCRNLPIVPGEPPNDPAERAPFVELTRSPSDVDEERGLTVHIEMITIA